jgi:hypothetical protein
MYAYSLLNTKMITYICMYVTRHCDFFQGRGGTRVCVLVFHTHLNKRFPTTIFLLVK